MQYTDILFAYDAVRRGVKTHDDILAMYREMPNPADTFDRSITLLHIAARFAHTAAVTYLLSQGCDPNAEDSSGVTPIWELAAQRGLNPLLFPKGEIYDTTTALLEAGASAMRKDQDGNLCYLVAANNGNGEFIKALYDKGVRITHADESGNNGLHLIFEALVNPMRDFENAKKRVEDEIARGGREDYIESQKRVLADLQTKLDYILYTTFLAAKAFLDAGVDPEDKNDMGETAHVLAQRRGAKKISALLKGEITGEEAVDSQAELQAKIGGMTLHQAILAHDLEAVSTIIELGGDANAIDKIYEYGEGTALAAACWGCRFDTVQLLLQAGADPNLKAGNGSSPLTWMLFPPNMMQISKAFDENWPAKIIDAMVKAGLNINGTVNDAGDTLLTWALNPDNHNLEAFVDRDTLRILIVKSALKNGADVNLPNRFGQTPLMLCGLGSDHSMKLADDIQLLLLEKGADLAAKDQNGNTSLIYIAYNSDKRKAKDMAENLFDFGDPLVDAANNDQKTALDFATEKDNEMLVKLLLNNM